MKVKWKLLRGIKWTHGVVSENKSGEGYGGNMVKVGNVPT